MKNECWEDRSGSDTVETSEWLALLLHLSLSPCSWPRNFEACPLPADGQYISHLLMVD